MPSQMMTQALSGPIAGKRRVAHLIADAVYRRLTGFDGYFDSLIAYVAESGPTIRPVTRLAVMDADGGNQRYLTDGRDLVLFPRVSADLRDIAYLSISEGGRTKIVLYHLATQQTEGLDEFSGITSAPSFSPDGTKLAVSLSKEGNSNIYEIDLRSRQARRLTEGEWFDTAPSYSPDGASLVFSTNRSGTEQLYIMSADGSKPRRISFGYGSYGAPAWSPVGNRIAFSKLGKDRAYIGFMSVDGTGEKLLAEGNEIGAPSWAPNGEVIVYEWRNANARAGSGVSAKLICVDAGRHGEVQIPTSEAAAEPSWSSLLR